jgi:hypothetical protein
MWHLIVHFWVSDGTFGTARGGNFLDKAACEVVGKDFMHHFPHTTRYECVKE